MPCIAGPAPAAQRESAPLPAAAAATEAPAAVGEGRKKKKRNSRHAEEAPVDHADPGGGIALFGGQEGQGQAELHAAADPAAAFVDSEPHVATGDPFEEANVIRKAHKIKVGSSRRREGKYRSGRSLAGRMCLPVCWPAPSASWSELAAWLPDISEAVRIGPTDLQSNSGSRCCPSLVPAGVRNVATCAAAQLCGAGVDARLQQAPAQVGRLAGQQRGCRASLPSVNLIRASNASALLLHEWASRTHTNRPCIQPLNLPSSPPCCAATWRAAGSPSPPPSSGRQPPPCLAAGSCWPSPPPALARRSPSFCPWSCACGS